MPKQEVLVIVESPNKCRTIEKLLGPGYKVVASCGHFCDLDKKDYVDIDNNFKPKYVVVKKDIIKRIKDLIKKCSEVIIATDLDREGEAIGYHLLRELKLPHSTKRIIFNEITKPALTKAINNPTVVDEYVFDAYQARIILDKLLGFRISPVIWAYVKDRTSAGRCQSPALSIVLDKELEIGNFKKEKYFSVESEFGTESLQNSEPIIGKLIKRLNSKSEVGKLIEIVKTSRGEIIKVDTKIKKVYPPKPYITSSVQQDASNLLGLSPQICNNVLKQLYEKAKITYPRTDLDELSDEAKMISKEVIVNQFGKKYLGKDVKRKNKKKENTQEAHEAIRPVDLTLSKIDELSDLEQKLYYMIWKRTIQSRMTHRENEVLEIVIKLLDKASNKEYTYKYAINYISCKFDGFTILNTGKKPEINIAEIQKLFSIGSYLDINKTIYTEQYTKPKPRLTEADLIKSLERLGIGRPSTYASIITTLLTRNYMEIKNTEAIEMDCEQLIQIGDKIDSKIVKKYIPIEKRKIFITELGTTVCKFLKDNFGIIMNYGYTSDVNKKLDIISEGKLIWHNVVREQYDIFNPIVEQLLISKPNMKDSSVLIGEIDSMKYYKYKGKFGWTIKWNIGKKPKFLKMPDSLVNKIDIIQISDIKDIIPVDLGKYKKYNVFIKSGEFGKYLNWNKTNVSIDDKNITIERAIDLINDKLNNKNKKINLKVLKEIKQYKVINGQYGVFVTNGKKNKKIHGNKSIEDIDLKYCDALFKKK